MLRRPDSCMVAWLFVAPMLPGAWDFVAELARMRFVDVLGADGLVARSAPAGLADALGAEGFVARFRLADWQSENIVVIPA